MISCPECLAFLPSSEAAAILRPRHDVAGICGSCGHLILIGRDDSSLYTSRMTRERIVKLDGSKTLHDSQEEVHFNNGHWG